MKDNEKLLIQKLIDAPGITKSQKQFIWKIKRYQGISNFKNWELKKILWKIKRNTNFKFPDNLKQSIADLSHKDDDYRKNTAIILSKFDQDKEFAIILYPENNTTFIEQLPNIQNKLNNFFIFYPVPSSLTALLYFFMFGKYGKYKYWIGDNYESINYIHCESDIIKKECLNIHPILNPNTANTFLNFKKAITCTGDTLKNILEKEKKNFSDKYTFVETNIEKIFFHTNVNIFSRIISQLLQIINHKNKNYPNTEIFINYYEEKEQKTDFLICSLEFKRKLNKDMLKYIGFELDSISNLIYKYHYNEYSKYDILPRYYKLKELLQQSEEDIYYTYKFSFYKT